MTDPAKIMARIRAHGANLMVDGGKLKIINGKKLPPDALAYIKQHGREIADWLCTEADFEERAAIMEYDGGLTRSVAEYVTRLLHASTPSGVAAADWSFFVGKAAQIVDQSLARAA